jgi:hypothetical protein
MTTGSNAVLDLLGMEFHLWSTRINQSRVLSVSRLYLLPEVYLTKILHNPCGVWSDRGGHRPVVLNLYETAAQ